MRILAVTTRSPWPLHEGRALRTFNILREIARNHEVHLATFLQAQEELDGLHEMRKFCADVYAEPLYMAAPRRELALDLAADLVSPAPILATKYRRATMRAKLREWLKSRKFDVLHLDMLHLGRELALAGDTPVVLYAGTFEPYQGLPTLLDAFPRVRSAVPGAVMVLVGGEGEAAAAIERDVAERGLSGAVRLVGRKPREEIPGYLAMADVLVSPRRYGANLPLKVFDYLAAGRPIVATDVPAHRAVLDESLARLTAPSADALAEAIVELLQHPSRAAAIAESGRAYAARHFGWQRFVQAVSSIYDGAATRADVRASV